MEKKFRLMKKTSIRKTKKNQNDKSKKKGIGGWLLFFVIQLSVISFIYLVILMLIIFSYLFNSPLNALPKMGINELIVQTLITYIIIKALYSLIKHKNDAISLVNKVLIMSIIDKFILIAEYKLKYTLFHSKFSGQPIPSLVNSISILIMWLLYFKTSKRIENTFPKSKRTSNVWDNVLFYVAISIMIIDFLTSLYGQ